MRRAVTSLPTLAHVAAAACHPVRPRSCGTMLLPACAPRGPRPVSRLVSTALQRPRVGGPLLPTIALGWPYQSGCSVSRSQPRTYAGQAEAAPNMSMETTDSGVLGFEEVSSGKALLWHLSCPTFVVALYRLLTGVSPPTRVASCAALSPHIMSYAAIDYLRPVVRCLFPTRVSTYAPPTHPHCVNCPTSSLACVIECCSQI